MINRIDDYFEYVKNHPASKIVMYGAGKMAKENYKHVGHIDCFCDKQAVSIKNIEGIPCILPEEIKNISGHIIMLICIKNKDIVNDVCAMVEAMKLDIEIFDFFDNSSFPVFDSSLYSYQCEPKEKIKICIVYSDDNWIFGKFANKLKEEISSRGYEIKISDKEDPDADVNHFISYGKLTQFYGRSNTVRTTMITHIDCLMKKELIEFQAENNAVGICMSSDTVNKLSLWGVPRNKLCYINPAQDGEIKPRKIVLGITNRCYRDYDFRKRDDLILEVFRYLDPDFFKLKIMGSGWNEIIDQINRLGFETEYYEQFDKNIYMRLMADLDYWIYYGFDEGAMGYLDALAAGVKTITTPQGYHLDTAYGLTHPCCTIEDFISTLKQIEEDKRKIVSAVKNWTWSNYAKKHLEIWHYLTRTKSMKELYGHQNEYMDGIFSMMLDNISVL